MESLSRPRHRKHSNASDFSAKNAYDDVFAGAPKFGVPTFTSRVEDYREIFGGSQGSRVSSIPMLDLSSLDERNVSVDYRSSKLDYSKIFGGFRDEDIGVSYDELIAKPKGGRISSAKPRTPAEIGSPLPGSGCFNSSEAGESFSREASNTSFDGMKQFNMSYHKTSPRCEEGTNGTTHIAQLHAVPGFTCFIDEMTPSKKTEDLKPKGTVINAVHTNMDSSEGIQEGKRGKKAVSHPANKQTPVPIVKSRNGSSWDGSCSDGRLFNAYEINVKSPSSKGTPASSMPAGSHSNNSKRHSKRSMSSNFEAFKYDASKGAAGDSSPPFFEEEMDVNSVAATSAAALKLAIERAQESIRIAKELMERKKDGFHSRSNWSFKDSLNIKGREENRIAREENKMRRMNAKETCERVDSLFQVSAGTERKNVLETGEIAPDFKDGLKSSVGRKVVQETNGENLKSAEAMPWLSELANTEKHRAATASIDKHEYEFKEIVRTKETSDQQEETRQIDDMNRKRNAVYMTQEWEENVDKLELASIMHEHEKDGKSGIPQEDEETEEKQKGFHEEKKCEKILKESQAEIDEKKSEYQVLISDHEKRLDEAQELVENEKEQQEASEQEQIQNRVGDAHVMEEHENRLGKIHIEEEIEKRLKEASQWLENANKLKEASVSESNQRKLKEANEEEDREERLDEVYERKIDESSPTDANDGEESENRPKEPCQREESESKSKEACQWEENEKGLTGIDSYKETESIQRETDQSKANEKIEVTEAVYEKNPHMVRNACEHDANSNVYEIRVTELSDKVETSQEAVVFEENERILGAAEAFCEFEDDGKEADAVKGAFKLDENEMLKASSLVQGVTEENKNQNKMIDTSDAHPSDDNWTSYGLTDMSFRQKQIEQDDKESELASTDVDNDVEILFHEAREHEENANDETIFDDEEEKDNLQTANEERKSVENGKIPELAFNVYNDIEILFHESREHEENAVDDTIFYDDEEKDNLQTANAERQVVVENGKILEASQPNVSEGEEKSMEIDEEIKTVQDTEMNEENLSKTSAMEEKETKETVQKEAGGKEHLRELEEANKREREWEKDRLVVERAIREARERAFAEARERAERAAVEKATAEVRQRVMAEAREKLEKASAATKSTTEKASMEAKRRAERAAVERATSEARERALEKALSLKTTSEARAPAERFVAEKFSSASRDRVLRQSFSSSDLESFNVTNYESDQRRKARLDRHQRIMERASKALEEKNTRDLLVQKEQAERNRLAEVLDADIKRWASGKEGNLRALLSTLQYILGPSSAWQPISLTDLITTNAVKKAYRKATLYVHPDKLQQRGASIQQKYICEKVFDLLKAAWNRFNSEER